MVFIDGENLVMRFQAMCLAGREPHVEVITEENIFAWSPYCLNSLKSKDVIRVSYYTYATGDDDCLRAIRDRMRRLPITPTHTNSTFPDHLFPVVLKKAKRSAKSRGVDIRMAVDILENVYRNNIDCVCLLSGDGDFLPILEVAAKSGKVVVLGALSSGLDARLLEQADDFIDLDHCLFA